MDTDSHIQTVHLIFPMAGQGARFGYTFKPFLHIEDETFIEAALRPFRAWLGQIASLTFVYLLQQEQEFSISSRLHNLFPGLDFQIVHLPKPTSGPAQTVAQAVMSLNISGPALVCDCDHSIEISPLFARLQHPPAVACLLPIWSILPEEASSWSTVALTANKRPIAIAEKRIPFGAQNYAGIIGCYYFCQIERIAQRIIEKHFTNLSEVISQMLERGESIEVVSIRDAEFFGDPQRLSHALKHRESHRNATIQVRKQ